MHSGNLASSPKNTHQRIEDLIRSLGSGHPSRIIINTWHMMGDMASIWGEIWTWVYISTLGNKTRIYIKEMPLILVQILECDTARRTVRNWRHLLNQSQCARLHCTANENAWTPHRHSHAVTRSRHHTFRPWVFHSHTKFALMSME